MAVYIIVQENLHGDQAPFEEYRKHVIGTFTPYGGKFLARGGKVQEVEANVVADPPKKPDNKYGSRPI